jgi:tetratricopeptide (TPR) repeat protein
MFSNLFGKESALKLYEKGRSLYASGRTEQAVERLSDAIKMEEARANPDKRFLSNIYCLRGEVYLSVGVALLSQSDFAIALENNSQNESALNNLGIWFSIEHFNTPNYEKAFEYFDRAIAIQPGRKDIQLNKACVKIQAGDKTGCDELRRLERDGYPPAKIALERFCKG